MFVQIQNDMNDLESNLMDEINWANDTVNWAYMDLSDADLTFAYLSYADLSNADLRYADLSNANLTGADLSNADLSGANLIPVNWNDTTCPDGTNSDDNGNTCENNL